MTINQIYTRFSKFLSIWKNIFFQNISSKWSHFFYLLLGVSIFTIFIIISNLINKKNKIEQQNLIAVIETKEFSNLSNYFVSKLNSPYKEIKYLIQTNDSIEKIPAAALSTIDAENLSRILENGKARFV